MDLDFVDPPLEPGMVPYRLGVAPADAREELRAIAQELREGDRLTDEWAELAAQGLEDPVAVQLYADNAPFIERFMTIELDTEHDIAKGIARVHPKEPPPRFGDKFRKPLRREDVREAILPLVDGYLFRGFATGAVANGLWRVKLEFRFGEPAAKRWVWFMRGVPSAYAEFTKDGTDPAHPMAGIRNVVCAPLDEAFEEVIPMLARRERGQLRAATYSWYFAAVGWSAYHASVGED